MTVKIPDVLVEEIDALWPRLGYQSRSEYIRAAIQFYTAYVRRRLEEEQLRIASNAKVVHIRG